MSGAIDSFSGRYHFLSNFFPAALIWEGAQYPTSEHAFNAGKSLDLKQRAWVASASGPYEAKRRGQLVNLRADWDKRVRYLVMAEVLEAKFTAHPARVEALLATGDAALIEGNRWNDQIWGDCRCGKTACRGPGQNHLGRLLTALRDYLRAPLAERAQARLAYYAGAVPLRAPADAPRQSELFTTTTTAGVVDAPGRDLFACGADALVNPVNCGGVMGAGLALEFKRRFPDNYAAYREACERGAVRPGRVLVYDRRPASQPRFVINFPTKRSWRDSSRLQDVAAGLGDLAHVTRELGIASLAVPALGCGLGGLDWADVRPLVDSAFAGAAARVLVYAPQESAASK